MGSFVFGDRFGCRSGSNASDIYVIAVFNNCDAVAPIFEIFNFCVWILGKSRLDIE
jgi:hypothetical protein